MKAETERAFREWLADQKAERFAQEFVGRIEAECMAAAYAPLRGSLWESIKGLFTRDAN